MQVIQLNEFGGPEVLKLVEVADPVPGPGEALVRVVASGVNFAETLARQGRYAVNPALPGILGSEVAGVVEKLGEGVLNPAIGTRVAAPIFAAGRLDGGYAEKVVIPANLLVEIPSALTFEDAAALQIQGLTAAYLLKQVAVAGRSILIQTAAGGVGSLLVQLAKTAGASRIIAAASTDEKRALAKSLGADEAIDYTRNDWPLAVREATDGAGVEIIFDSGVDHPARSLDALAFGGELVVYGALSLSSFSLAGADFVPLAFKNATVRGFTLLPLLTPAGLHEELPKLFVSAATRELQVIRGGSYPLAQASQAHRALEGRSTTGKLILVP